MVRLGMRVSDSTILRRVKHHARTKPNRPAIRVAGVDEWAWRKGTKFGTIVVDLERRRVVDLLADRVAARMANWFKQHPEVEIINRDRDGLYADAARQGAPQARQVADRFHLLKNLRDTIARHLGGFEAPIRAFATEVEDDHDTPEQPRINRSDRNSETAERERLKRRRRAARRAMFDRIRALYDAGGTVREIAQKLGLGRRRVYRWVRHIDLPERNAMAPKPCTPAYCGTFLARSWAEGTTKVRQLFADIRDRGYTGSYSHLTRFLAPWRNDSPSQDRDDGLSADQERLLGLREQGHVDRALPTTQHGAQGNHQDLVEVVQPGVARTRVLEAVQTGDKLLHGNSPLRHAGSRRIHICRAGQVSRLACQAKPKCESPGGRGQIGSSRAAFASIKATKAAANNNIATSSRRSSRGCSG